MTLLFQVGGIDTNRLIDYVESNQDDFSPDPNQSRIDVENEDIRLFGFFSLVEKAKATKDLYDECSYFRIESVSPTKGTGTVNTIRIYNADGTKSRGYCSSTD